MPSLLPETSLPPHASLPRTSLQCHLVSHYAERRDMVAWMVSSALRLVKRCWFDSLPLTAVWYTPQQGVLAVAHFFNGKLSVSYMYIMIIMA